MDREQSAGETWRTPELMSAICWQTICGGSMLRIPLAIATSRGQLNTTIKAQLVHCMPSVYPSIARTTTST
jgi:hypothetical protein